MANHNAIEILLIEDNLNDAELAIRSLRRHNLANHLFHVHDGVEALEFLFGTGAYSDRRTSPAPRVVLLDIKLPRVDGIEVLRRIKSDERTKTIPVVMLTSSKEERDVIDSYKLGANSYILKPVDFDKFAQVVSDLGLYWMVLNEPPKGREGTP